MLANLESRLHQIAAIWLDQKSPVRQAALRDAAPEFCLSQASFDLALDWIFKLWLEVPLEEALSKNKFKNSRYAVQVLAGTSPAMIAQGFFQGALLNIPQCLKIPSRQPTFAKLLHQSFLEIMPTPLFELNTGGENLPQFYSCLAKADLVLAYGQDETMETLKQKLAPHAIFIPHGEVLSAAIIFKEAANFSSLEKLAYDFLSYDQRGCLSPCLALIESGGELSPAACARFFAEEILPPLAKRLPRGGLFPGEAAAILHQRSLNRFRGLVYTGTDWTVCYDETLSWPEATLPRFLPFKPFEKRSDLVGFLQASKAPLISVGFAGENAALRLLAQSGTQRNVTLGEMQRQLLLF
jgi:hypothetical protein